MNNYGFVRVASASPIIEVANCEKNTENIIKLIDNAINKQVSFIVFPELCITGYTCGDLFFQKRLLDDALNSLIKLKNYSKGKNICFTVGLPLMVSNSLYNCAAFICNGEILGIIPKTSIPNYNEFYEKRWFASSKNLIEEEIVIDSQIVPIGNDLIFSHQNMDIFKIGIEICEDLWLPIPPSSSLSLNGATVLANLSASNDLVGKSNYRKQLISSQSGKTLSTYLYASCGFGESTTDVVFGGHCFIYENGVCLKENTPFQLESSLITSDVDLEKLVADRIKMNTYGDSYFHIQNQSFREIVFNFNLPLFELDRNIDPHPFVPNDKSIRNERCEEIFTLQTAGLVKRIYHIRCEKVVIGISGGLDSTLALLVCIKAFDMLGKDRKNIICVTMPGFGTTDRTYNNAVKLVKNLGATLKEISIKDACIQHFKDISHDINIHDVTYENGQARERTQILMDLSNKEKGIVVGTGDLSELALGWATYNGDHMSMYAVNVSIPKTLVRYLVDWVATTQVDKGTKLVLKDILDTPVSPELLPPDTKGNIVQKTEEVVGPYELHDFFLYHVIRFGFTPSKIYLLAKKAFHNSYKPEVILNWLKIFYRRFFSQQFKRSCSPDGPKVGSICLSPRGDWRMPSDAVVTSWLKELEDIKS